jgi:hypothetical protein
VVDDSNIDIQLIAVPLIVTVLKLLEVMGVGRGLLWNIIPTVACRTLGTLNHDTTHDGSGFDGVRSGHHPNTTHKLYR